MGYAGSAEGAREYPGWSIPEIAVTGRSNAGKSSLLNCLAGRRGLARVSRTPGRTQRLHFFSCSTARGDFALVDLPGYGFAAAPDGARERWGRAVEAYLFDRENLRALLILVDARRDPGSDEEQLEDLAARRGLEVIRIATKIDKLGLAERRRRLRALAETRREWIPFSARTREGRDRCLEALVAAAGA